MKPSGEDNVSIGGSGTYNWKAQDSPRTENEKSLIPNVIGQIRKRQTRKVCCFDR